MRHFRHCPLKAGRTGCQLGQYKLLSEFKHLWKKSGASRTRLRIASVILYGVTERNCVIRFQAGDSRQDLNPMPWGAAGRGKKGQLAEGMDSLVIYGSINHVLAMRRICAYRAAGVTKKSLSNMFGYSNLYIKSAV